MNTERLMHIRWVLAGAANNISQVSHFYNVVEPDDAARLVQIADAIRTFDFELADRLAQMCGEED